MNDLVDKHVTKKISQTQITQKVDLYNPAKDLKIALAEDSKNSMPIQSLF